MTTPHLRLHTPKDLTRLARHWGLAPALSSTPTPLEDDPDTALATCLARSNSLALYHIQHHGRATHARMRAWSRALHARAPHTPHILIAALPHTPNPKHLTLAAPLLAEERHTLTISRFPTQPLTPEATHTLQQLFDAGAHADGIPEILLMNLELLLERRPLGAAFVRDFRRATRELADAFTGIPTEHTDHRHTLAFTTLSRLLFLAFLQARGWLDGRTDYLLEEITLAESQQRNPWRDFLQPLFFSALNTPTHLREPHTATLGTIPYLNGGLFQPTHLEIQHPTLSLPTPHLRHLLDSLFTRYVFATAEPTEHPSAPTSCDRLIDPKMLGHVFEALMAEHARADSGSFYTPRRIVERLTTHALTAWARSALPETPARSTLDALFAHGDAHTLDPDTAALLDDALTHIRVLDPAAGSGAFIIGAFHAILRARTALRARAGRTLQPHALRRHIATHNLYGVDLLPEAIRLCELRLWLALSADAPDLDPADIPPLPNLDLHLRVGDTLLEPHDLDTLITPSPDNPRHRPLLELKERYIHASGPLKAELATRITATERDLFLHDLDDAKQNLQSRIDALSRLRTSHTLFGEPRGLNADERSLLSQLQTRLQSLRELHTATTTHDSPPAFSPHLHFVEVMRHGGFDLILSNPPWLRPHRIPARLKKSLRSRYRVFHDAAWRHGAALGRSIKAGQVDLAAVFVERALLLARPHATVCMLIPAKLLRALSGAGLRRLIDERAHVLSIVDWSDAPDRLFGHSTATFPAMILLHAHTEAQVATTHIEHIQPDGQPRRFSIPTTHLNLITSDPASPWILTPPESRANIHAMRRSGPPLGSTRRLTRGVVTGSNRTFLTTGVVPQPGSDRVIAHFAGSPDTPIERDLLRPALRGADISAFAANPSRLLLFPHHPTTAEPLPALPEATARYLANQRDALTRRSDLRPSMHLWTLFRARPELLGPKVVWRDIATRLEAAYIPPTHHHPILGETTLVPLNTVYVCPVPDDDTGYLLTALLNAQPVRDFTHTLAERAKDGHRRFFSWLVGLIPDPLSTADPATRRELIDASRTLHGHSPTPPSPPQREHLLHRIDTLVAHLYQTPLLHTHAAS